MGRSLQRKVRIDMDNMNETIDKPRRGRLPLNKVQNRAEETRRERRFKPGNILHTGMKLTVDESHLDRDKYKYRFANDKDNRVSQLESHDWDVVSSEGETDGIGSVQSKHAGSIDGKPYQTVLMRKHRDWYEEDANRKQTALVDVEQNIRTGHGNATDDPELRDGGVYTPGGGNIIGG